MLNMLILILVATTWHGNAATPTQANSSSNEPMESRYHKAQKRNQELRVSAQDYLSDISLKGDKVKYADYLRAKNAKLKTHLSELSNILTLPTDQQEAKMNEVLARLRARNSQLKDEYSTISRQNSGNEVHVDDFNKARRAAMLQHLNGNASAAPFTIGAQMPDNISRTEGEVDQNQYNALRRQQILAKKGGS